MFRTPTALVLLASLAALTTSASCVGTESGNPPLIDRALTQIASVGSALEVSGSAGAVQPGGITVQFANAGSAPALVEVAVNEDGSFIGTIPGAGDDEVRIVAVEEELRSNLVSLRVVQDGPTPLDCFSVASLDTDVAVGSDGMIDLINNCATAIDVSPATVVIGATPLTITPSAAISVGASERRTFTFATSASSPGLEHLLVRFTLTRGMDTEDRTVSVFVR